MIACFYTKWLGWYEHNHQLPCRNGIHLHLLRRSHERQPCHAVFWHVFGSRHSHIVSVGRSRMDGIACCRMRLGNIRASATIQACQTPPSRRYLAANEKRHLTQQSRSRRHLKELLAHGVAVKLGAFGGMGYGNRRYGAVKLTAPRRDCKIRRLSHGQDAYSVAAPDGSCRAVKLSA